jgi:hypothetical protein
MVYQQACKLGCEGTVVGGCLSRGVLMNFGDAIKLGFANYVNFSDWACRSEYWYWYLFAVVGLFATSVFDSSIVGGRSPTRSSSWPHSCQACRWRFVGFMIWIGVAGGYCWP